MSLKTTVQHIISWIEKEFSIVENKIAPVAVGIFQHIKQALDSGLPDFIATALDMITKSNVPSEFVAIVRNQLPRALATALAIEGLPPNPTNVEIAQFADNVMTAWGLPSTNRSRIATIVTTDLYRELKAFADSSGTENWIVDAEEVEKCFQILQADIKSVNG